MLLSSGTRWSAIEGKLSSISFGAEANSFRIPQREVRNWCSDNFLSYQTLNDIASNRSQYMTSLREIGFIPHRIDPAFNKSNSNTALIRSLVAGAFNPQLARIDFPDKKFAQSVSGAVELDPEARTIKYFNQENGRVFVHPSSTLFDAQTFPGNAAYMSYFNKMATSKVFIRDLTRKFLYSFMIHKFLKLIYDQHSTPIQLFCSQGLSHLTRWAEVSWWMAGCGSAAGRALVSW